MDARGGCQCLNTAQHKLGELLDWKDAGMFVFHVIVHAYLRHGRYTPRITGAGRVQPNPLHRLYNHAV